MRILGGIVLLVVACVAFAQPKARIWKIGAVYGVNPELTRQYMGAFLQAMEQHGYAVGKNLEIVSRSAEGDPSRYAALVDEVIAQKPDALLAFLSPRLNALRKEIASQAASLRMPSIAHPEGYSEDGGLMSYGPSFVEAWRHTAYFVDKIAKGANPATLPIEQPRKFTFLINGKTARMLGIKIPQPILVRADRVIE